MTYIYITANSRTPVQGTSQSSHINFMILLHSIIKDELFYHLFIYFLFIYFFYFTYIYITEFSRHGVKATTFKANAKVKDLASKAKTKDLTSNAMAKSLD